MSKFPTSIRPAVPTDVNYILKTWLRCQRLEHPRALPDDLFYNEYQKILVQIVQKAEARVAADPSDVSIIQGFAVGRHVPELNSLVLHFVYVRKEFRNLGIATQLVENLGWRPGLDEIVATHWAHRHLQAFNLPKVVYNPYILYGVKK